MGLQKSLASEKRIVWALCEQIDSLVVLADGEGRLQALNHAAMELSGLKEADVPGHSIEQLIVLAEPALHSPLDSLAALLAAHAEGAAGQYCLIDCQRHAHKIEGVVSRIFDSHQKLEKILVVARAVVERPQAG